MFEVAHIVAITKVDTAPVFDFSIEEGTLLAMKQNIPLIREVRPFKLAEELNRYEGNEMLTEESVNAVAPYGLNALEENFFVEQLSSSRMTLRNGILRLHFKKM